MWIIILLLFNCLIVDIINAAFMKQPTYDDAMAHPITGMNILSSTTTITNESTTTRQSHSDRYVENIQSSATSHLATATMNTVMAHQLDHPLVTQWIDESWIAQLDVPSMVHQKRDTFIPHWIDSETSHETDDPVPVLYYFAANHITTITNASKINEETTTYTHNHITYICQYRDRISRKSHFIDTTNNMHCVRNTMTLSFASTASILSMASDTDHITSTDYRFGGIQHTLTSMTHHRTNSRPLRCRQTVNGEHSLVVRKSWRYPSCIGHVDTLYGGHSDNMVQRTEIDVPCVVLAFGRIPAFINRRLLSGGELKRWLAVEWLWSLVSCAGGDGMCHLLR